MNLSGLHAIHRSLAADFVGRSIFVIPVFSEESCRVRLWNSFILW